MPNQDREIGNSRYVEMLLFPFSNQPMLKTCNGRLQSLLMIDEMGYILLTTDCISTGLAEGRGIL